MIVSQWQSFSSSLFPLKLRILPIMNDDRFQIAVQAARVYLVHSYPFYSYLLHRASIVADDSIGTACVNAAGRIRINPDFFLGLDTPLKQAFILAHEILHPAFGYFWRAAKHHPRLANRAHDYVINYILSLETEAWLPGDCLFDKRFAGMAYEEVYSLIKSELPTLDTPKYGTVRVNVSSGESPGGTTPKNGKKGDRKGKGALSGGEMEQILVSRPTDGVVDIGVIGGLGDDTEWEAGSDEVDWGMEVARAAEAARMKGDLPAHIARFVGGLLTPVISWQDQLRLAVTEALSKTRDDWSMPHRRSEAYGFYAPMERFLGFDVSVCVDTSGSVTSAELKRAVSEIQSIVEQTGGEGRYLVGDAAIHADVALRDFRPEMLSGGGGTSFVPHFEYLERYPTKMCIFFTDTFGEFPLKTPSFPVIWAVYRPAMQSGAAVPFGEIVEVDV